LNSHVQIPKSILKNFAYKSKKDGLVVDYLDLNDDTIKTEKIKKLDTIPDYYNEEFERYLSDNIEGPFGDISKKVRDISKKKIDNPKLTLKEINAVLNFFETSFKRGKFALDLANRTSVTSILHPISQEELIYTTSRFFINYFVNIIRNETKIDFVIPRNCTSISLSKTKDKFHAILPFTPRIALVLIPNEEKPEYITKDKKVRLICINDADILRYYNMSALKTEIEMNNMFIVGNKRELFWLKKYIK
jgi:hypothetical protein